MAAVPVSINIAQSNHMLDLITTTLKLKNDAALAVAMGADPPVISKLRHGKLAFGATLVIRTHELTGWPIKDILALLPKLRGTKEA